MKTKLSFMLAFVLAFAFSCQKKIDTAKADVTNRNKEVAARYHDLIAEDIDSILTENFVGRTTRNWHTWDREEHRSWLSSDSYKVDSIINKITSR